MIGQTTHHVSHYSILSDAKAEALSRLVETAIHNGWQPWGAMSTTEQDGAPLYVQAMVKYADRFR
ncbi:DUF1737 domain-containing protein [Ponticoccus sp. SC2-23]|uniref:DUF1737 domain-containing protein n=1 Tax=Alexandriicola marinus TaxID=2081710 RepID=UPI000FD6E175|nr:DUF1737 domain-containing protein [Alexandriicola marinus]MBM1219646.1 DUF1737 domain-containing protein [Ponticoccus sp. SC6-9]MBM1223282.1 DUF1737 domain-containing protein [Ponticoccus sp. SC6-15]MBM1229459.1 DUF1737 domain-containing protein [Ponticoccus sp. SC6-38]MBM1232248.1 DUF1737 domain-containing protein [Ponticoccus sp. SC6-45]MBM1237802.1 DUF1737 domain-containing protein [Ponticoccus sp. SC6-49]MBM1241259.1 DUF1737 domain-containing protein [Ponticoccus sp. SC2-64]MBM1245772